MPKRYLSYVLASIVLFAGMLSWRSIKVSIFGEGIESVAFSLVYFSFYVIFLGLFFVLVRERVFSLIVIFFSIFLSIFFVEKFVFMALACFFAFLLIISARELVRRDIDKSVKISLTKSLNRGAYEIVLALALMISAQYFFSVSHLGSQDIIPEVSSNRISTKVISLMLSRISPEFNEVDSEEITVDEFLEEVYMVILRRQTDKLEGQLDQEQIGMLQSLVGAESIEFGNISEDVKSTAINEWKKGISEEAGYEIRGDEKITDITIALANSKINKFVDGGGKDGREFNFLSLVFAAALFLMLIPVGTLLSKIWSIISYFVFVILRSSGIVKVGTQLKKVEVIE